MSTPANPPAPPPVPPTPPRSSRKYLWHTVLGRTVLVAGILLAAALGGLLWYASTPQFANLVRTKLIATLEQATGGRVELASFRWQLRHLAFEADGLTIHGLEAANEAPYAHIDRIYVRVKILSFFLPKIDLSYLEADHPAFHLIVYPDGSTNQPRPKTESSGKPLKDTLFDLAVSRTEIHDGVALINQRAIPFDLAANDLGLVVTYAAPRDHYLATLHVADITARRGQRPPVRSQLDLAADIGRNTLNVSQLQLQTGANVLKAVAVVNDFANPHWSLAVQGKLDVREVMALAPVDGVDRGIADINLKGEGTRAKFSLDGQAKVAGAAYHAGTVRIAGVNVETALHATMDELALTGIRARLDRGGSVDAEMRLAHWLGTASTATGQSVAATRKATIRAKISGITLRTVMASVAPPHYEDLGFDTVISGDGNVDWTGDASDLTAKGNMSFVPSAHTPDGEVPLTGNVDATYFQKSGGVEIRQLQANTPATQIHVEGGLGVYPIERASMLQADVETANLGEFDRVLAVLGVASGGKTGVQALPLRLQGQAQFHGSVSGSLSAPDVKGHLTASNFDLLLPAQAAQQTAAVKTGAAETASVKTASAETAPQSIHWDTLDADAEYSPLLISVSQATLTRGKTAIHASGELHAHSISARSSSFDEHSAIHADVRIQNAAVEDILVLTGQSIPVTGTLNLDAHADGWLQDLNGGGHLAVQGGQAYGEPYRSLNADLRFAGEEIGASKLTLLQNGGQLTGNGGYDIRSKQFHFTAEGHGFDLAHFEHLKHSKYPVTGQLVFSADGSGTFESPTVHANAHVTKIAVGPQANGAIDVEAHTDRNTLLVTGSARLSTALMQVQGQMGLTGDYPLQAHVTLANLDIDPFMEMFQVQGVRGHSSIAGNLNVSGPLRQLDRMQGDAQISQLSVTLYNRPLNSEGPLHAVLRNGVLQFDPMHITGDNTDLRAQGRIGLLRESRMLNLQAQGSVDMKLLHMLDSSMESSGEVTFTMKAGGTFERPDLTGQVKLTNVAVSVEDFPNGLSQLNGTLEFDQDRLQVKSLTGTTGGGQVSVGGYVTYQQGIYADLNATGKDIRIRYPVGISSVIDTKLRFQGTQNNLLLSGTALLKRFSISPNLDFASFAGSSSGVSPPPDPNAFANHVRLEVHLTSSPELDFENSYAKLAGDVDLRVRGTIAQPSVLGHITVTEGSATFAGTQYQLQHGDIYFTNPVRIDPVIDLDATAHVEDYDITIGLHGTPSNLSPTFRSEPPLTQQDIFSLLAMGRTQEEQSIYSAQQQQAGVNSTADALLGGALNATVSSRIQRLFGGGSVKIDPSWVGSLGDSTARITVAQQVSKNATLTYATNINSTAQQLIQAEVHVTQNTSILAVRDESGVFSLMFKVHKRYH